MKWILETVRLNVETAINWLCFQSTPYAEFHVFTEYARHAQYFKYFLIIRKKGTIVTISK